MTDIDFLVRKDRLTETELRAATAAPLTDGQVRLAIDRFSFTANNVSYAATGDALKPEPPATRCW